MSVLMVNSIILNIVERTIIIMLYPYNDNS